LYDLSRPELQFQCLGRPIARVSLSSSFAVFFPVWVVNFIQVRLILNLVFEKLNLHFSDGLCLLHATPLGSPAFSFPTQPVASHFTIHTLEHGSQALLLVLLLRSASPDTLRLLSFGLLKCLVVYIILYCLGFSLPLGESFVFKFVLVSLLFAVSDLSSNNFYRFSHFLVFVAISKLHMSLL
jgi:hypothetical protein